MLWQTDGKPARVKSEGAANSEHDCRAGTFLGASQMDVRYWQDTGGHPLPILTGGEGALQDPRLPTALGFNLFFKGCAIPQVSQLKLGEVVKHEGVQGAGRGHFRWVSVEQGENWEQERSGIGSSTGLTCYLQFHKREQPLFKYKFKRWQKEFSTVESSTQAKCPVFGDGAPFMPWK